MIIGLISTRSLDIFNILIHIGKRQVADDSYSLPLKGHLGFLLFAWGLEDLLGLELEELLPYLLLLKCLRLPYRSRRKRHTLNLPHHLSLLVSDSQW